MPSNGQSGHTIGSQQAPYQQTPGGWQGQPIQPVAGVPQPPAGGMQKSWAPAMPQLLASPWAQPSWAQPMPSIGGPMGPTQNTPQPGGPWSSLLPPAAPPPPAPMPLNTTMAGGIMGNDGPGGMTSMPAAMPSLDAPAGLMPGLSGQSPPSANISAQPAQMPGGDGPGGASAMIKEKYRRMMGGVA